MSCPAFAAAQEPFRAPRPAVEAHRTREVIAPVEGRAHIPGMTLELAAYRPAILAFGVMGALYLLQLLVADVVGIRRKHTPGAPVTAGHDDLHFRTVRAHANTSESIAAFVLLGLFAIGVGATPSWVNGLLWTFVAARAAHMAMYYLDVRIFRSVAFGLGVVALGLLFGLGLRAL
jgi:uncharacterized MAPEG superfamily protein